MVFSLTQLYTTIINYQVTSIKELLSDKKRNPPPHFLSLEGRGAIQRIAAL